MCGFESLGDISRRLLERWAADAGEERSIGRREPKMGAATVKIGDVVLEVREDLPVQPAYVDLYTECRLAGGDALSLATLVKDGDGAFHARVCARLRMPLDTLRNIQGAIEAALAAKAAGQPKGAVN